VVVTAINAHGIANLYAKDVDFAAELFERKGVKYFTNPVYERKSDRWKMVFRAGKEVVEVARAFVQQWMLELK
jgi:hypothetical protein